MADWELSETAIADLLGIAVFTGESWGLGQSDAYLEAIYAAIERVAEYPSLGAMREDLTAGLRMMPTRQHRLYYNAVGERVVVVRILHGAQDEAQEFASRP